MTWLVLLIPFAWAGFMVYLFRNCGQNNAAGW